MAEGEVSGTAGAVQYGRAGFTRSSTTSGTGSGDGVTETQVHSIVDSKIAAQDLYTPAEAAADMDAKIAAVRPDRKTVSFTTASLASGAGADHTAALAGALVAHSLTLSHAGRLRLYRTAAARTADVARAPGGAIADSVIQNILLDLVLPFDNSLSINLEDVVCALANDGVCYWRVTNLSGAAAAVTTTLSYLTLEGL